MRVESNRNAMIGTDIQVREGEGGGVVEIPNNSGISYRCA